MPSFGTPRRSIIPSKRRTLRKIDGFAKKGTRHLCFWEILRTVSGAGVAKVKDMV